jgi:GNAT superfamily N-acetyltransferase
MITEATPYDILQLGKLGKAFIDRSVSGKFITFDEEGFVNGLFRLLSIGTMKVWVAKIEGRIAGAVCLLISPNLYNPMELLGDIYFIDVLPEYQKQGIAGKLMAVVEEFAKLTGIKALTISFKQKEIADRICETRGYLAFEYRLIKKVGD